MKTNNTDLLARFTAATAVAIRDFARVKKIGLAKAVILWERANAPATPEVVETTVVETNAGEFSTTTGMADAEVIPAEVVAPPAKKTKKAKAAAAPVQFTVGAKAVKSNDARIKMLVDSYPRRTGTLAHAHFQALAKASTVGEYKAMFEKDAQKTAMQWLHNFKNYNFCALDETPAEPQS